MARVGGMGERLVPKASDKAVYTNARQTPYAESNTLAAAAVFLSGIVADSFSAHDPSTPLEAPVALRTTSVVLVACLASPPIRDPYYVQQRVAFIVAVVLIAFAGQHVFGRGTRIADVVYTVVTLGACLLTFWSGGAVGSLDIYRATRSKGAAPFVRREALANLSSSMLLYASLRALRVALVYPSAVRTFETSAQVGEANEPSYAYASVTTVGALAFGAAAGVGVSVVMVLNEEIRLHGTSAATLVLTTGAFAQLVGAFVATLAHTEQLVELPVLWTSAACSDATLCPAAFRARRFALVNGATTPLWFNGLGTLLMAFSPSLRLRSRMDSSSVEATFQMAAYAVLGIAVCLAAVYNYLSFTGSEAYTDYAVLGALIGVALSAFVSTTFGIFVYVVAIGGDILLMVQTYGPSSIFAHFTHCSNAIIIVLLGTYLIMSVTTDIVWYCLTPRAVEACERAVGVVAVCGTSIAFVLYLGTTALILGYTGQHLPDTQYRAGDARYARTTAIMIAEHWIPLFIWLPLYGCRCEVEMLSNRVRALAWYLSLLLPGIAWITMLLITGNTIVSAYGFEWSFDFVIAGVITTAIPWMVVVWA